MVQKMSSPGVVWKRRGGAKRDLIPTHVNKTEQTNKAPHVKILFPSEAKSLFTLTLR